MEESKELKNLYSFLQGLIYITIFIEAGVLFGHSFSLIQLNEKAQLLWLKFRHFGIYSNIFYSKFFTLALIVIVSIGTRAMKNTDLKLWKHIVLPLSIGAVFFFGSVWVLYFKAKPVSFCPLTLPQICYTLISIVGAVLIQTGLDNISKHITSGLMSDRFNIDNESFEQTRDKIETPSSISIRMKFYHNRRFHSGYINIVNPFRGTLLLGTPGSGKSFGVVNSFIRQHSEKGFMLAVYDFKFPDLARLAFHYYNQNRAKKIIPNNTQFHIINLTDVEYSRRVNPLKHDFIQILADAQETAEALVESLKKGGSNGGADQFFSQSAINFLAATIYFFAKYEGGKYATFPHVMAFLNQNYESMFKVLFSEPELDSLLSPFKTAFENKAFDQLEGQIGTLKIHISRLATKETFWVFSGDDVNLKITDRHNPSYLVIANNPNTQNVNSASNALILMRLVRLINSRGNLPCSIIIDEAPTLYFYKLENLLATARSNQVSTLLGLQELPQLKQQYGKETAETICAICGNVISGSVRNKDTLEWLEKLFGKVKQVKESISINRNNTTVSQNENMDYLIPSAKIANLRTGEMVAKVALEATHTVQNSYNCQINLDLKAIETEEKQYQDLPLYYDFKGRKEEVLKNNYLKINQDIAEIVLQFQFVNY
jgi:TraM recognition site of TraD and TraG/YWFCY protein